MPASSGVRVTMASTACTVSCSSSQMACAACGVWVGVACCVSSGGSGRWGGVQREAASFNQRRIGSGSRLPGPTRLRPAAPRTLYTMRCRLTADLPSNSRLTTTISTCRPSPCAAARARSGAEWGGVSAWRSSAGSFQWDHASTASRARRSTPQQPSSSTHAELRDACQQPLPPLLPHLHVLYLHHLRLERRLDLAPHLLHQRAADVVVHAAAGAVG